MLKVYYYAFLLHLGSTLRPSLPFIMNIIEFSAALFFAVPVYLPALWTEGTTVLKSL